MVRQGLVDEFYGSASTLQRLRRRSRCVQVSVTDGGFLVDSFRVSDPKVLRSELRTIYRHLPKNEGQVRLRGVEEAWLPLGLDRNSRQIDLENVADALFFLAA